MELTVKRQMILETVNRYPVPVNAMQIFNSSGKKINLATIYRGLQYLSDNKRIESFTLDCKKEGTIKYFYSRKLPHEHFFHCEKCHNFIPVPHCSVSRDAKIFEKENNCSISSHVLYFTGMCSKCRK